MYTIRVATASDHASITDLITHYQMVPPIFAPTCRWWVATDSQAAVVATIGAEQGGDAWLLRSAIVARDARGHGLGRQLTTALIAAAQQQSIHCVYCFSTDAGEFWQHMDSTKCRWHTCSLRYHTCHKLHNLRHSGGCLAKSHGVTMSIHVSSPNIHLGSCH